MKVLYVQHDANLMGGVAQVLLQMIEGMSRTHGEIEPFVVMPEEGSLQKALREMGVRALTIPAPVFPGCTRDGACRYIAGVQARAGKIRDFILEEGIDLVHTHSHYVFEGALAALQSGKPHIWHIHGNFEFFSKPSVFCALPLSRSSIGRMYGMLADRIIAVSADAAAFYKEHRSYATIEVIHNGLEISRFDRLAVERCGLDIRSALGLAPDTALVGTVGRITLQKNLLLFLEAAKLVRERLSDVHFLIIGPESDSTYAQRLKEWLRENSLEECVHFLGGRDDVPALYRQMDVFVLSSDYEGLPIVCLEAMASERPVVSTICGGTEETVVDGVTGFLVRKGDLTGISNAVIQIVTDPDLRRRMGRAGRQRINEFFSSERLVDRIVSTYRELTQTSRPDRDPNHLLITELFVNLAAQNAAEELLRAKLESRLSTLEQSIDRVQQTQVYRFLKAVYKGITKVGKTVQ